MSQIWGRLCLPLSRFKSRRLILICAATLAPRSNYLGSWSNTRIPRMLWSGNVCVKMASYFRCFSVARLVIFLDSNFERTLRLPNVRAVAVCTMSAPAAYSVHVATLFFAWETIFWRAYEATKGVLML